MFHQSASAPHMSVYWTRMQVQFCFQRIFSITLNLAAPLFSKYANYNSISFSFIITSHKTLVRPSDVSPFSSKQHFLYPFLSIEAFGGSTNSDSIQFLWILRFLKSFPKYHYKWFSTFTHVCSRLFSKYNMDGLIFFCLNKFNSDNFYCNSFLMVCYKFSQSTWWSQNTFCP